MRIVNLPFSACSIFVYCAWFERSACSNCCRSSSVIVSLVRIVSIVLLLFSICCCAIAICAWRAFLSLCFLNIFPNASLYPLTSASFLPSISILTLVSQFFSSSNIFFCVGSFGSSVMRVVSTGGSSLIGASSIIFCSLGDLAKSHKIFFFIVVLYSLLLSDS